MAGLRNPARTSCRTRRRIDATNWRQIARASADAIAWRHALFPVPDLVAVLGRLLDHARRGPSGWAARFDFLTGRPGLPSFIEKEPSVTQITAAAAARIPAVSIRAVTGASDALSTSVRAEQLRRAEIESLIAAEP